MGSEGVVIVVSDVTLACAIALRLFDGIASLPYNRTFVLLIPDSWQPLPCALATCESRKNYSQPEGDNHMSENKTRPTDQDVIDFLNSVDHKTRREDGIALLEMMKEVTDERLRCGEAVLWALAATITNMKVGARAICP